MSLPSRRSAGRFATLVALGSVLLAGIVRADESDPRAALRRAHRLAQGAAARRLSADHLAASSGIDRDVGNIAVIEHEGGDYAKDLSPGVPNYDARAAVARRFYETHGDDYDFLVVFTNFEFDTGPALAFFNFVRNDVQGTGRPLADVGALFGSPSRLKGYIDMCAISRYRTPPLTSVRPGEPGFTLTLNTLAHEMAHQWLVGVRYRKGGVDSTDLLGQQSAHWSYLLDTDASVMYGSDWVAKAPGSYTAERVREIYSPLDRYLMGFLDPARVPDFTLIRNPTVDPTQLPILDATLSGTAETVRLQQIVDAEGARAPDFRSSQKEFRLGFVFLTAPGVEPSAEDLEAVETIRKAFVPHLFAMTHGVAVADTTLEGGSDAAASGSPDLAKALAWLLSQQGIDGSWGDSSRTIVRDTAAAVEALARGGVRGASYDRGLAFLRGTSPTAPDFVARQALALAGNDLPAADAGPLATRLLGYGNADGGFGAGTGYASDPLDTALVLRALRALGRPADPAVARAVKALGQLRSADGAWPVVPGGPTSTVVSAYVLLALQDWSALPDSQALLGPGLAALLARQNPDGGFGESPSNPFASALAYEVLLRAGAPASVVSAAGAWLQGAQLPDGSWRSSPFETALVLGALKEGLTTNLVVPADHLVLTPPEAREDEVVEVAAVVRNSGRAPAPASVARLYDGPPERGALVAEAAVPALDPGAESAVRFDFPTTDRAGDRTLYVRADADDVVLESREDDNTASRVLHVEGRLPDLVVAGIVASPDTPESGEPVRITVTVRNDGEKAAPATRLQIALGDSRFGAPVLGELPVGPLPPGAAASVTLGWSTTGILGPQILVATADAGFDAPESNETNNEASLPITVETAAPDGPALAIASLTLKPSVLKTIPQRIEARVLVRNRGRAAVAASTVSLFDTYPAWWVTPVAEATFALGPRSSTNIVVPFTVANGSTSVIYAVVDRAEAVPDPDRGDNVIAATLENPRNTLDLELVPGSVSPSSSDLLVGETLSVTVDVRNRGTADVFDIPVVLTRAAADGGGELARTLVTVGAGQTAAAPLVWKTTIAGDPVSLLLRADPFGLLDELDEANNDAPFAVRIRPSGLPNIRLTGADLSISPAEPRQGESATVSARVRNTGTVAAGAFVVRFFAGDPDQGGLPIGESSLTELGGSSDTTVTIAWPFVNVHGALGLFAVADALGQVEEFDETDNRAFRPFRAVGFPDLVLTAGEVVFEPAYPRAGESVTVHATVRNLGGQEAGPSVLAAYAGEPLTGAPVATLPVGTLAAGASETVTFAWTPAGPPGGQAISLVADPGGAIPEQDEGNNVVRRTIVVQSADLFLSDPYFSPDGDGVKDETVLGYRSTGGVTIDVSNSRGQRVRRLLVEGPSEGSVTWDGRNDRGLLLADGTYTFTLTGDGRRVLGRREVVLDTNRSAIHDSTPRDLALRNLTCALPPSVYGLAWMPAEDEALTTVVSPDPAYPDFPTGLVRLTLDGQASYVGKDDDFYSRATFTEPNPVSPDGREVLMFFQGDLVAVDLASGHRRTVRSALSFSNQISWSPDGRFILIENTVITRTGEEVGELDPSPSSYFITNWAWSPGSDVLSGGGTIESRTGSLVREIALPVPFAPRSAANEARGDGKVVTILQVGGGGSGVARRGSARSAARSGAQRSCDDGECEDTVVFDPEDGTAARLDWLADRFDLQHWSPDGSRVLISDVLYTEGGIRLGKLLPDGSDVAPRATAAFFTKVRDDAHPGSICGGKFLDTQVLTTLLNLTAELTVSRLPGNTGLLLKGTATDRNLDHYQLDYARQGDPSTFVPIGPASEVPVGDDVFTTWVPPGPGTYVVRLRVFDLAGNVKTRTRVVSWDRVPAIANVSQTEVLISPNGDHVKDAVTFNYAVLDPTRLDVRIEGPQPSSPGTPPAHVVRTFAVDYPSIGPQSFAWDGRDDGGGVAPDGKYTVYLNDLPFRVEVDNTPPDIAWSWADLRSAAVTSPAECGIANVQVGAMVADRLWHVVDPRLRAWTFTSALSTITGTNEIYVPETDVSGTPIFDNGRPRMKRANNRAADVRDPDDGVDVAGIDPEARFTAEDHAGNKSTISVAAVAERLFLVEGRPDGCVAIVSTPPLKRILPPIEGTYALRRHTTFFLGSTVRGTDRTIAFEYRERAAARWTRASETIAGVFWEADLEGLGLLPGREYEGRFVNAGSHADVTTASFFFRICEAYLALGAPAGKTLVDPIANSDLATFNLDVASALPEPIAYAEVTFTRDVGPPERYRIESPDGTTLTKSIVSRRPPGCQTAGREFLSVDVTVVGATGTFYRHNGVCAHLVVEWPNCGYGLSLEQDFGYCKASPDTVTESVTWINSTADDQLTVERGQSGSFSVVDRYSPSVDFRCPTPSRKCDDRVTSIGVAGEPAGSFPVRARIDVAGVPDPVAAASSVALVDRQLPRGADLAVPPLCPARDPVLGREIVRIPVEALDDGPRVELGSAQFRASANGPWQPLLSACDVGETSSTCPFFPVGGVKPLLWDVTGLPGGEYTVRLDLCDRTGNHGPLEGQVTLLRDPPVLEAVSLTRKVFSPNGDGQADETTATFRTFQGLKVTAVVEAGGRGGAVVRTFFTDRSYGATDIPVTWDGKDANGNAVPDGVYAITVTGGDACGGVGAASRLVVVDDTPPTARILDPLPETHVSASADVIGTAVDLNIASWELAFGEGDTPIAFTPIRTGAQGVVVKPLGRWDPPASEGRYTLRLLVKDAAENRAEARVTVVVVPADFIRRLAATPDVFSPNADGRRDTTTLEYELKREALVTLQVRTPAGAVLRTLETGLRHPAASYAQTWDGLTDAHLPAPEGDLRLFVRAVDPSVATLLQEHSIGFVLDRTPPTVAVQSPAQGSVIARIPVSGSVSDEHLADWVLTARPAQGPALELARSTEPVVSGVLSTLDGLADGPYTLSVKATDRAENERPLDVSFTLDSVPPKVAFREPADRAVLRRGSTPITVGGLVRDPNLQGWTLRFGAGGSPSVLRPLAEGTTEGDALALAAWNVQSLPDGVYTLVLDAADKAGQSASATIVVTLDATRPVAEIVTPKEASYVSAPILVQGTAQDANLASWRLETSPGPAASAFRWEELGKGTEGVEQAGLASWSPLPPDGVYTLRLTAADKVGLTAVALRTVTVDTTPPAPPTGLGATVEKTSDTAADVRLTWNPNSEPDLAGYLVDLESSRLTGAAIPSPSYVDKGRVEAVYFYSVYAVDKAGNVSGPARLRVPIDLTPPLVGFLQPGAGARVSGAIDVRGTAWSAADFKEYRLYVGAGASPTSFALLERSTVPVASATLGEWLAIVPGPYVLALEAEDTAGNRGRVTRPVVVDIEPPPPPVLTFVNRSTTASDELTPVWQASAADDLAGYLVYRNGGLANAPGTVLGDLRAFVVTGLSYLDAGLPDGSHCYRVVAMDQAGNLSLPSNEICRPLDNRPPHAVIAEPSDGTRFGFPIRVAAFTPDRDVASVQFQFKPKTDVLWRPLGPPRTALPYETTLDPTSLARGTYDLRAVATDEGGRTDPAPESIGVIHGDVTPPAAPLALLAKVDGADVALAWTPSPESDFASYTVYRDGQRVATGVADAHSLDKNVTPGAYQYAATAVDADGNESAASDPASAIVYAVSLEPPAWPVVAGATASLHGDGARADTTVRLLRDGTYVAERASTGGAFAFDGVPLRPEGNVFTARGEDAAGNRSIPADEVVVISNTPPGAVTGLVPSVSGHTVRLAWDVVADADLFGYLVRRDGELRTPSTPQQAAAGFEASSDGANAALAFDADPGTFWSPVTDDGPAAWTVVFPKPVLLDRVHLRFPDGREPADYQVLVRWNGRFLPAVSAHGNDERVVDHVLPAPFATDALRVVIATGGLAEVAAYRLEAVPAGSTRSFEEDVADGKHVYRVTAIDRYGAEGEPGAVDVPVGDATGPSRPTGLIATPVGRDVQLTWNPNPEPDVATYAVLRDGSRIGTGRSPAYHDPALPNGTYAYTVLAVDAVGNESPESDPASATIAVAAEPPAAPVILAPTDAAHPIDLPSTVTEVSGRTDAGTVVGLERNGELWGFATAEPGLLLGGSRLLEFRASVALSADGSRAAFERLGFGGEVVTVEDLGSGDASTFGLPPGALVANAMAFSPDASRLALRVFFGPPANRYDLVLLTLGDASSRILAESLSSFDGSFGWSPDGSRLAFVSDTGVGVVDVATGASTTVAGAGNHRDFFPAWSPDGSRLTFLRSWFGTEGAELHVFEVGSLQDRVIEEQASTAYPASWSPDSRLLAVTVREGGRERVRIRDARNGGVLETLGDGDALIRDPRFSPSGRWLAYRRVDPGAFEQTIVARERGTGIQASAPSGFGSFEVPAAFQWAGERLAVVARQSLGFFTVEAGTFLFRNVTLAPGENRLVARATAVSSGLAGPDSEPVSVTVSGDFYPDLEVTPGDLRTSPASLRPGQPAVLKVDVRNVGGNQVEGTVLRVAVADAAGEIVLEQTADISFIDIGQSVQISVPWTPERVGTYRFRAEADPFGALPERREDNNAAGRDLTVVAEDALVAALDADRESYPALSPVHLTVRVTNGGVAFTGRGRTAVEDTAGQEVAVLDERPLSLAYGQEVAYEVDWNTGTTWAGTYRFRARVAADGSTDDSATAAKAFAIEPQRDVRARLTAETPSVPVSAPASFLARVENRSLNAPEDGLVSRVRLVAQGTANPTVFEAERPIPRLLPGGIFEASVAWPLAAPAGRYVATLEVRSGGDVVATAQSAVVVTAAAAVVTGRLALVPADVLRGTQAEARIAVTNEGAAAALGYPLSVDVVSGPSATVLATETLAADLPARGTATAMVSLATDALTPGAYIVRLRGGSPAATLDRARLGVHGVIAPPSIHSPSDGASVDTSHPLLTVNDATSPEGALLTYEFQLFADTELKNPLPGAAGIPETPERTAWRVVANLGEDRTYYWRSRASDGFSTSAWSAVTAFKVDARNLPPTAPVPEAPVPGAVVATRQPVLTVINGEDPEGVALVYEFRLSPREDMATVLASAGGIAQGVGTTSWLVPLVLEDGGVYWWSARASDGVGFSPWSRAVTFHVVTGNGTPTKPAPIRPVGGTGVATLTPELVTANATDPEDDALSYRFEVDRVPSFDSPERQASPDVAEGAADTRWTPLPLRDNTLYYWRVRATDGNTTSDWAVESFFVNLANDPPGVPVLLDPVDDRTVGTSTPALRLRNTSDPDGDPLTYAFEVRNTAGNVVASVTGVPSTGLETTWTVLDPLAENESFAWRARASDGQAEGGWAGPATFRVNAVADPPTKPIPLLPAEGDVVGVDHVTLVVTNATSPDGLPLTYTFELYAMEATGLRLVERASGVPESTGTTSFAPATRLEDGTYGWRARATDPQQDGAWSDSASFKVAIAPAAPTGLAAVPGNTAVSLSWRRNTEPDITGYRVFRSFAHGGPYAFVAATTSPAYPDTGLTNGVTVYYVVTALDAGSNESPYSLEVSATPLAPPPTKVLAEVRTTPVSLAGECLSPSCPARSQATAMTSGTAEDRAALLDAASSQGPVRPILECVADNPEGGLTAFFGYVNENDFDVTITVGSDNKFSPGAKDRGQTTKFAAGRTPAGRPAFLVSFREPKLTWTLRGRSVSAQGSSPRCTVPPPPANACPQWIYATVELPRGIDPSGIAVESVRMLGQVAPDPSYHPIVDRDGDGIPEMELRFESARLRSLLTLGANNARVTGRAGATDFEGTATITVFPLSANLWVTPRKLDRDGHGDVKARVTFLPGESASKVDIASVRLNGSVRVKKLVGVNANEIVLAFDRAAVLASLPRNHHRSSAAHNAARAGRVASGDDDDDDDDDGGDDHDDDATITLTGTIRCLGWTAVDRIETDDD
jgi:subtilase family serine protease/flagellar hook assembly protein FlgD